MECVNISRRKYFLSNHKNFVFRTLVSYPNEFPGAVPHAYKNKKVIEENKFFFYI